eukprot:TRINITY_DN174_c0_g1_i17.p1 TRINITY_DN174_c0_g1~~TRINITY_DN174_c0_g1_i17.p1  ORF type:complete len:412 (+),score=17.72 TRINITY_DN174_c0_g1_i17:4804-6039(+)
MLGHKRKGNHRGQPDASKEEKRRKTDEPLDQAAYDKAQRELETVVPGCKLPAEEFVEKNEAGPGPLNAEWDIVRSRSRGKLYYYNKITGKSHWKLPATVKRDEPRPELTALAKHGERSPASAPAAAATGLLPAVGVPASGSAGAPPAAGGFERKAAGRGKRGLKKKEKKRNVWFTDEKPDYEKANHELETVGLTKLPGCKLPADFLEEFVEKTFYRAEERAVSDSEDKVTMSFLWALLSRLVQSWYCWTLLRVVAKPQSSSPEHQPWRFDSIYKKIYPQNGFRIIVLLQDVDEDNGPIEIGCGLFGPEMGADDALKSLKDCEKRQVVGSAGDVFVMRSDVFHRGRANTSGCDRSILFAELLPRDVAPGDSNVAEWMRLAPERAHGDEAQVAIANFPFNVRSGTHVGIPLSS